MTDKQPLTFERDGVTRRLLQRRDDTGWVYDATPNDLRAVGWVPAHESVKLSAADLLIKRAYDAEARVAELERVVAEIRDAAEDADQQNPPEMVWPGTLLAILDSAPPPTGSPPAGNAGSTDVAGAIPAEASTGAGVEAGYGERGVGPVKQVRREEPPTFHAEPGSVMGDLLQRAQGTRSRKKYVRERVEPKMRTCEEIVKRCKNSKSIFGYDIEVLIQYLTFEQAKPLLKPEATSEGWTDVKPLNRETVLNDMREYMDFAWGKVINHRGISADRSVTKFKAWVWLLGDDDVLAKMKLADYAQYGAPILKIVCEQYGFPVPEDESIQRMMHGESCEPGCSMGCGS